tara:strand:- start:1106 stop:1384 length:279 start_codon:yes stop_codon:yes gene_type:complete
MAVQSRGSIEEGSVSFTNHTERTVNFVASTGANAADFPSPPVVKLISIDGSGVDAGNGNIGVTFTNITTTSMTVITSAPFTGTIRYLCSVQG